MEMQCPSKRMHVKLRAEKLRRRSADTKKDSPGLPFEVLEKVLLFSAPSTLRKILSYTRVHRCIESSALVLNAQCRTSDREAGECKEMLSRAHRAYAAMARGRPTPKISKIPQANVTQIALGDGLVHVSSDDASVCSYRADGSTAMRYAGHDGGVWTFQRAGAVMVTGSTDKTARIWCCTTGAELHRLQHHISTVRVVKCNGEYVLTGGRDGLIGVWSIDGRLLHALRGHTKSIRCMDCDGDYLVTGSYDGTVRLWDYKQGRYVRTLHTHSHRVYAVRLRNGTVASAGLDASVRVSSVDGARSCAHSGHSSLVAWIDLQDNYVVSSGADGTLIKYDYIYERAVFTIQMDSPIRGQAIRNNVLLVASSSVLRAYSFTTGKQLVEIFSAELIQTFAAEDFRIAVGFLDRGVQKIAVFDYDGGTG
ncbi:F-box and WD-40 domain protein 7 [Pancytospora philotis]|nr:F-box and WD-40 domain protein 7 [Pancytospora philotis]